MPLAVLIRRYLRDLGFGAVDGAVTTFAIVAGAVGADLGGGVILVLGVANLIADGRVPFPTDAPAPDRDRLRALVRARLRARLLALVARAVARDIRGENKE